CLAALDLHAPEVAAEARQAMAGAARDGDRVRPAPEAFARAPSISIDHAVMEKADKVAVAPVEMGWSDLGSFDALYELAAKDDDGNALAGEAIAIGSRNCLLRGEGARVVALGVEDLIVVAAGRDVLIVPRGQSQKVREAAKEMEKKGGDG
ncbi:MAG: mannose-1-phosphate guanyltransferase, partial [Sphingomonadaceae bacterium]